jgi:hypothetical protein
MKGISIFSPRAVIKGPALAVVGTAAVMLLSPDKVFAQEIYALTPETCATLNCGSLVLPGTVLSIPPSASTWVGKLFAAANECVRLDVDRQNADLRMVVVAPNGTIYRNDDRTATDFRPLVQINPTPNNGWYTVQLAKFNGQAVSANFTLFYGRYNAGNPNCGQAAVQPPGAGPGGFQIQVVPGIQGQDAAPDVNKPDTPVQAAPAGQPAAVQ